MVGGGHELLSTELSTISVDHFKNCTVSPAYDDLLTQRRTATVLGVEAQTAWKLTKRRGHTSLEALDLSTLRYIVALTVTLSTLIYATPVPPVRRQRAAVVSMK